VEAFTSVLSAIFGLVLSWQDKYMLHVTAAVSQVAGMKWTQRLKITVINRGKRDISIGKIRIEFPYRGSKVIWFDSKNKSFVILKQKQPESSVLHMDGDVFKFPSELENSEIFVIDSLGKEHKALRIRRRPFCLWR